MALLRAILHTSKHISQIIRRLSTILTILRWIDRCNIPNRDRWNSAKVGVDPTLLRIHSNWTIYNVMFAVFNNMCTIYGPYIIFINRWQNDLSIFVCHKLFFPHRFACAQYSNRSSSKNCCFITIVHLLCQANTISGCQHSVSCYCLL